MDGTLTRMVYLSKNLIVGDRSAQDEEISKILEASRYNNSGSEITGALLFNSVYFAQVLEGPQSAVESTFSRILADPRHEDVVLLGRGEVQGREFPDWSMAYAEPPKESDGQFQALLKKSLAKPGASQANMIEMTVLLRGLISPQP